MRIRDWSSDVCSSDLPLVAVLPGGTTNMTSADIGLRGGRTRGLARLIAAAADGSAARVITERHVVGVDRGVGEPIQYGMFFGTAGICRAIADRKSGVEGKRVTVR